jgi:hypothetical protein
MSAGPTGVVLYGGEVDHGDGTHVWLNDTWTWEGEWSRAAANGPQLHDVTMGYDATRRQLLLVGMTTELTDDDEVADAKPLQTWAWTGAAWTPATTTDGEPHPSLASPVAAWDAATGELILVERDATAGGPTGAMATWRWSGGRWTEVLSPTGGPEGPSTPVDHLVPGLDGHLAVPGPAGWSWDGHVWLPASTPLPADAIGAAAPSGGLLFLGADPVTPLRPEALLWRDGRVNRLPAPPGPVREGAVIATDMARHTTLVVGGPASAGAVLSWDGSVWSQG